MPTSSGSQPTSPVHCNGIRDETKSSPNDAADYNSTLFPDQQVFEAFFKMNGAANSKRNIRMLFYM